MSRITCSVCLQDHTARRAQVFIVVGGEHGDPAVMGFCYEHAAGTVGRLHEMAKPQARTQAPAAKIVQFRPRA